MNQGQSPAHAPAWVFFTYVSFAGALGMLVLGIALLPLDLWMRAFLFMGMLMLVQACVIMTKTQRDMHENARLVNRIEDARTKKLLMGVGRPAERQGACVDAWKRFLVAISQPASEKGMASAGRR